MAKNTYLRIFVFLFIFLVTHNISNAQIYYGADANDIIHGAKIVKTNTNEQIPEYIKFKNGSEIPFESFQEWLKKKFKIDDNLTLQLIKTETDQLGFTHYRFKQYFNIF